MGPGVPPASLECAGSGLPGRRRRAGQVAYDSVALAWHDYLAHFNDGKPIVLLGHSQGSAILIELLQREVDNDPAMRPRLVSALILGGNVEVPAGGASGRRSPTSRPAGPPPRPAA